jgi:hypothetical protein
MKKQPGLTSGVSEPETVKDYMKALDHPMKKVAEELRTLILSVDKSIGEGIAWNAPVFYFTGKMEEFNPKDYKRYIVGYNFFKKDQLRIIFLRGVSVTDKKGLLEGDYKDGRRLANFTSLEDLKSKEKALKDIIKQLLKSIHE